MEEGAKGPLALPLMFISPYTNELEYRTKRKRQSNLPKSYLPGFKKIVVGKCKGKYHRYIVPGNELIGIES